MPLLLTMRHVLCFDLRHLRDDSEHHLDYGDVKQVGGIARKASATFTACDRIATTETNIAVEADKPMTQRSEGLLADACLASGSRFYAAH
jgi:hypothetical protein